MNNIQQEELSKIENEKESFEIIQNIVLSYKNKPEEQSLEAWVCQELANNKLYQAQEELQKDAFEIVNSITTAHRNKEEITSVLEKKKSVESWVVKKIQEGAKQANIKEIGKYAYTIEQSLQEANELSLKTFINQDGLINQNKNLHGFIAEEHHVNSFNIEASLHGSNYRAHMLQSTGKNSVDIVIKDLITGKIVKKYGAKYGVDASATKSYLKKGDYKGQRKLVPDGQHTQIQNATNYIEMDGIQSKPLSYEDARAIQKEIQEKNHIQEYNWDKVNKTKVAKSIVIESGKIVLMHTLIQGGRILSRRVYNTIRSQKNPAIQEDIKEWLETSWNGAKDIGLEVAVSTGVLIAAKKGLLGTVAKNTPAGQIANMVYVGMENTKVIYKMAKGELGFKEGIQEMQKVSLSAIGGIIGATKGMAVGAAIGSVAGPVGAVIGGFVGSVIGGIVGSGAGELIAKTDQKIREVALKGVEESYKSMKNTFSIMQNIALPRLA